MKYMGSLTVNLLSDRLDSLDQPPAASASTSTTPKLSFKSLPKKPDYDEPLGMLTPPLNAAVSVPFQWELAPGKPRPYTTSTEPDTTATKTAARCLELPPRLSAPVDGKLVAGAGMPSPTTVLDGPDFYAGPSKRSLSSTLSFRKLGGSFRRYSSPEREDSKVFGSMRWGLGREKFDHGGGFSGGGGGGGGGDFDFLAAAVHGGGSGGAKVKITRVKRGRSFLGSSSHTKSSNLLANIYEGLKQVVPWRRRHEKTIHNQHHLTL